MRERVLGENNPMYGKRGKDNPSYGKTPNRKIDRKCLPMSGKNNPFFGKKHTESVKKILSERQNKNKKKVVMCDIITGEKVMEFESLSSANKYLRLNSEFTKADDGAIGKCAKGIYKNVYGHKWMFE